MPQARKKHTVHQMQIGRFSIKFLLEDFVMIGHESPKFGQRCPNETTGKSHLVAVASRVLKH
jgi:hypothetical protein